MYVAAVEGDPFPPVGAILGTCLLWQDAEQHEGHQQTGCSGECVTRAVHGLLWMMKKMINGGRASQSLHYVFAVLQRVPIE